MKRKFKSILVLLALLIISSHFLMIEFNSSQFNQNLGEFDEYLNIKTSSPSITINSPTPNQVFGSTEPSFNVYIQNANDTCWYNIGGLTNFTFTTNGSINQAAWDGQGNGTVTIRFYANDTTGNLGYSEVTVRKDINDPSIIINSPTNNELFGTTAPDFDLTILEGNLNLTWYTMDGGLTNYTFTGASGTINQAAWNLLPNGTVTIRFYANDTLGNVNWLEVTVRKDISSPSNSQFPNWIFIIAIVSIIIAVLAISIAIVSKKRTAVPKKVKEKKAEISVEERREQERLKEEERREKERQKIEAKERKIKMDLQKRISSVDQLIKENKLELAMKKLVRIQEEARVQNLTDIVNEAEEKIISCKKSEVETINRIKQTILILGAKFTRLQLVDISEKSGIKDETLIENVIQDMIRNKEIRGEYFSSSKALALEAAAPVRIEEKVRKLNVFISYSTLDTDYFQVSKIVRRLELYPEIKEVLFWEADSKQNIVEFMEETLRKTDAFILFCSENSMKSEAVKGEWQAAYQMLKKGLMKIIPVYEIEDNIPRLLWQMLNVKFTKDDFEGFIQKLYEEIIR